MKHEKTESTAKDLIIVPQPRKKTGGKRKTSEMKSAKRRFVRAFEDALGNVSVACATVGISRVTYYRWVESDSVFRAKLAELRIEEKRADLIEAKFLELVAEKNAQVVIHGAKTALRGRGYGEPIRQADSDELDRLRRLIEARAELESVSFGAMLQTVREQYSHLFKRELLERLARENLSE